MVNSKKLKAKLKERNLTQEEAARKMEINPATFNKKINNEEGDTLTVKEVEKLSEILGLNKEDLPDYFFYEKTCVNARK